MKGVTLVLREKRTITKEEKEYLLSLKPSDITLPLLQELFADTYDPVKKKVIPSKFNTYDEFSLSKNEYFNKEDIKVTNCGLFILNKFLFEEKLVDIVGYVNTPFDKKTIGKVQSKLDAALLEDEIDTETYIEFLNKFTWIAFSFNTEVSTSLTINSMKEQPVVKKAREEMIKKNKDKLQPGNVDIATVTKMEADLVEVARKGMENDPAMDLYESGARGSFNVAYKNAQIMKGPVLNTSNNQWEVVLTPQIEGISKNDVPVMANNIIDSAYSKSIAPGECGYMTKKLSAAFQGVVLGKRGSDCGTKAYSTIKITEDTFNYYKYQYMIEGSKLVRLDPSNKDKYMGKTVKMRTNDYCIGVGKKKDTCNMCAGDMYYMIGMENIGLTTPRISNSMLNARFKVMHDSTVKTFEITPEDFD